MKKILILAGTSRTGKTTVCSRFNQKYNYNVIKIDAIINAINVVSETKVNKDDIYNDNVKNIIESLIKNVWVDTNFREYKYIIETCSLLPQKAKQIIQKFDYVKIIFLIDTSSVFELKNKIVQTQKDYDWTKNLSDEELLNTCESLNRISMLYEKDCKTSKIDYIDVKNFSMDEIEYKLKKYLEEK